jgi:hypothetical protein
MSDFTAKDVELMFGSLTGCCLHNPVWTPVDIAEVLCSVEDSGGWTDCTRPSEDAYQQWKRGTESTSYTVVRLKDGRYGLLEEGEDYTGHGCQCDASTNVYDSLDDLLRLGIEEYRCEARDAIRARIEVTS